MLRKFQPISRFPHILNNIEIFENIDQNQNFWIFLAQSPFSIFFNKIEIFRQFWRKSRFFRYFDQNYIKKNDQKQDFR